MDHEGYSESAQGWSPEDNFEDIGLDPVVTPKFLCADKCVGCGHCAIGCPTGAKWDTRALVDEAVAMGAKLITGCRVKRLEIEQGRVTAVSACHMSQKGRIIPTHFENESE